jgi:hypothetical protein
VTHSGAARQVLGFPSVLKSSVRILCFAKNSVERMANGRPSRTLARLLMDSVTLRRLRLRESGRLRVDIMRFAF